MAADHHPVRIVIVDDHEIVRAGLTAILNRERDIELAGVAATGEEALDLIARVAPDIAVVDYSLPGITGVELCEHITEKHPNVAVILLTTFLEDNVIHGALDAGARAFVYKDIAGYELKRAIRAVASGDPVIDPKIANRVAKWRGERQYAGDEPRLSRREVQVLRLVARGFSNEDIGAELGLTPNTIRTYMRRAMAKLGCRTRSEAAAVAGRSGLL